MNILIVTAHPKEGGATHSIAQVYGDVKRQKGDMVELIDLYNPEFALPFYRLDHDPEAEAVIKRSQELISWANEIVVVHPVWWGTAPAIMKNWTDTVFAPRFSYHYDEHGKVIKLLTGKTAKVFATSGGPSWLYTFFFSPLVFQWKYEIFGFCGVKTTDIKVCGGMNKTKGDPKIGSVEVFLEKVEQSAKFV
jgi:putative NADPH-quinone reductase